MRQRLISLLSVTPEKIYFHQPQGNPPAINYPVSPLLSLSLRQLQGCPWRISAWNKALWPSSLSPLYQFLGQNSAPISLNKVQLVYLSFLFFFFCTCWPLVCLYYRNVYSDPLLTFFPFIFISWRLITLQYCSGFCHTLTWISHGFTCVPHPDPPSRLPPYLIPLGFPSAPALSTCLMHPTWAGDLFHTC